MKNYHSKKYNDKGAALLVFALLVLTISSAVFLYSTNNTLDTNLQTTQKTQRALADAKKTMEQLSLAFIPNVSLSQNEIGRLPFPDRALDGEYDGNADCLNYTFSLSNLSLFLGQFPRISSSTNCSPIININQDLKDGGGNQLWYAVSPNMVDNIANVGFSPSFLIDSPSRPNWLSIYNANGTLISDRIAFIIFSPGPALDGQSRLNSNPRHFLDNFDVPGVGSVSNYDADLIFVKAPLSETFNDLLVYMTIDELMPKLEKRVLSEFKTQLISYQLNNGFYPLPASLGTTNCDITLQNSGGGFIATTDNAATPCNQPPLTIPSYLTAWLPFVIYEPRRDCNQNIQTGCNNNPNPNGLTVNNISNVDFTLISTGYNAPIDVTNRAEYLEDSINQADDQVFITPSIAPSISRDQLLYR